MKKFSWPCGQVCPFPGLSLHNWGMGWWPAVPALPGVGHFKTLLLVRRWGKGGGSGRESLFLREKDSSSGRNQMSQMGTCSAPACFQNGFCSPTPTVAFFSLHHQQRSTLCNRDLFWRKGRSWSPCREHQNYFWINCHCDHSLIPHKHRTNAAPVKVAGFVLSLLNLRLLFHILIEIKELITYNLDYTWGTQAQLPAELGKF